MLCHTYCNFVLKISEIRQTGLFSATIDDKVKNLAKLALKSNPKLISVIDNKQSTANGLQQGYVIICN